MQTQLRGEQHVDPLGKQPQSKPATRLAQAESLLSRGRLSPGAPTERGCYSWMPYECQTARMAAFVWQLDPTSRSRQACHGRKQSFDQQCKHGATQLLWIVGEVPERPEAVGCHVWYPYGCPNQEKSDGWKLVDKATNNWTRPVEFIKTQRVEEAYNLFHHANSSLEGCKQWKEHIDQQCDAPVLAFWRTLHGAEYMEGFLEYDDETGEEETWVATAASAKRFKTIQGVAFRNSLNMHDMDKYSGVLWGQQVSGRVTSDGAWVHVRDVGFLPIHLNKTLVLERDEVLCHDARPGEDCYSEVLWARDTGLKDHPGWYPGLTPTSSVRDFQSHLHQMGKGSCPRPCEIIS